MHTASFAVCFGLDTKYESCFDYIHTPQKSQNKFAANPTFLIGSNESQFEFKYSGELNWMLSFWERINYFSYARMQCRTIVLPLRSRSTIASLQYGIQCFIYDFLIFFRLSGHRKIQKPCQIFWIWMQNNKVFFGYFLIWFANYALCDYQLRNNNITYNGVIQQSTFSIFGFENFAFGIQLLHSTCHTYWIALFSTIRENFFDISHGKYRTADIVACLAVAVPVVVAVA